MCIVFVGIVCCFVECVRFVVGNCEVVGCSIVVWCYGCLGIFGLDFVKVDVFGVGFLVNVKGSEISDSFCFYVVCRSWSWSYR